MITALVSMFSGLVSGSVPGLLKEWQAGREHKRETEMLNIQTTLQIKLAVENRTLRLAELDKEMDLAKIDGETRLAEFDRKLEMVAYDAQTAIAKASMKPIGITWVDSWNASMRPFAVTIIIALFAVLAFWYAYNIFQVMPKLTTIDDVDTVAKLLWGSLIGEAIQAVLGFLFGYRSARK